MKKGLKGLVAVMVSLSLVVLPITPGWTISDEDFWAAYWADEEVVGVEVWITGPTEVYQGESADYEAVCHFIDVQRRAEAEDFETFTVDFPEDYKGYYTVEYKMHGVCGYLDVNVIADLNAPKVFIFGLTEVITGSTHTYEVLLMDSENNILSDYMKDVTFDEDPGETATVEAEINGYTGSLDVSVIADSNAPKVFIFGLTEVITGSTHTYEVLLMDSEDNILSDHMKDVTFDEDPGETATVEAEINGYTGSLDVSVIADPNAPKVFIFGLTEVITGSTHTYEVLLMDSEDNILSDHMKDVTFDEDPGETATVEAEINGYTGSLDVSVIADPNAPKVFIFGLTEVITGSTHTYEVLLMDSEDNILSDHMKDVTFDEDPGETATVEAEINGYTGSLDVSVIADPNAPKVFIFGLTEVITGSTHTYEVLLMDSEDNILSDHMKDVTFDEDPGETVYPLISASTVAVSPGSSSNVTSFIWSLRILSSLSISKTS